MKKQGDVYLKITAILLAVLICVYALVSVFGHDGQTYSLETAVYCEVGDGVSVSGFVVRSESAIVTDQTIVVDELSEGARVGAGQSVATAYRSSEERARRQTLETLKAQLTQLQNAGNSADSGELLDTEIAELIVSLSAQTAQRNYAAAASLTARLEPYVLRRSVEGGTAVEEKIAQLTEQIAALEQETGSGVQSITVSASGYFSEHADGYETLLTPASIMTVSVSELKALMKNRATAPQGAIGRLVVGQKWYFVAQLPEQWASYCRVGYDVKVSFAGEELQGLSMEVERISEPEDGECVLVLSCERKLQRVTALRRQSADVVFDSDEGIRVPKRAVYYYKEQTGVFVLQAGRANFKPIEIVRENGESYVVRYDPYDTDKLQPGDEIILTSGEIDNGKVMK